MTLLIAALLIAGLDLNPGLYFIAVGVWILHMVVRA